MIGKIKGIIKEVDSNVGLIETTGGVFYQVFLTPELLKEKGKLLEIYTYLQVRDDALVLFGFSQKKQLDFFKMLLTVSGIGPKTAFTVVSFSDVENLIKAIKEKNTSFLTDIPGLGKKTGLKILVELSSKIGDSFQKEDLILSDEDKLVVDALLSLGYKTYEIKKALTKVDKKLKVEEKIKAVLKILSKQI